MALFSRKKGFISWTYYIIYQIIIAFSLNTVFSVFSAPTEKEVDHCHDYFWGNIVENIFF